MQDGRKNIGAVGVALALGLVLALASLAFASKGVDSTFGTKSGTPALGGTFNAPEGVAVRQSTGQIYVADKENHRIQRFGVDDNGTPGDPSDDVHVFERAWGWDVVQAGGAGDTVDGSFEICTVASQCQAGVPGGDGGQFGEGTQAVALAIDQVSGAVYATDVRNRRVQKFDADGSFLRAWGSDVVASGPGNDGGAEICVPAVGDVCKAGESGELAGELRTSLFGLAVDSAGNVYVAEGSTRRVQKFDPSGNPLRLWGWDVVATGPGNLAGDDEQQMVTVNATGGTFKLSFDGQTSPKPIAFDVSAEGLEKALEEISSIGNWSHVDVAGPAGGPWTVTFVVKLGSRDVPQITADGSGLTGGAATASVSTLVEGAVYEICVLGNGDVCKVGVGALGNFENPLYRGASDVGMFTNSALFVAIDALDRVYVSDGAAGRIQRFQSDGSSPEVFSVEPQGQGPEKLALDRGDGHVYAMRRTAPTESVIAELDPSGALVDTHAVGRGIAPDQTRGMALNESSGRLYLASTQRDHWVIVLDDDGGFEAGGASPQPATDVGQHSATLNGIVSPNGFETTYRFEYSLDGVQWTAVGSPQSAGSGSAGVPVSVGVGGLQAGTSYKFRIAVQTLFAGDGLSAEESFTTSASVPDAQTIYPQARTATTAILTGLLNPNNSATEYHFEYGETTAYGSKAPVPDGAQAGGSIVVVTAPVSGLQPDTTYHYRLVATNGEGVDLGDDVNFTTRSALPAPTRALEMVTPPFKVTRATVLGGGVDGMNANPGSPSVDGNAVRWGLGYLPLLEETRVALSGDQLISRRTASGWKTNSLYTQPLMLEETYSGVGGAQLASSGDHEVGAWRIGAPLLPNESSEPLLRYTRRDGTGANGWTGWLTDVAAQEVDVPPLDRGRLTPDLALLNDSGDAMARWGHARGVAEKPEQSGDEDPSDELQLEGLEGGRTIYLQLDPPHGEKDLVAECTGSGPTATLLPERADNGTPASSADDLLGARACAPGELTSVRGATVGGYESGGSAATALADDGRRLFFMSPDPVHAEAPTGCTASTGAASDCPPQLFVRQYDAAGDPTVRWLSRPAPGMPSQSIGLLSTAVFQGASRDGRFVYFNTATPLTPDDPNGTGAPGPVVAGSPSGSSWDLYRYELPQSRDEDPAGGTLFRVSGGPTGTADPNTASSGATARYVSDDGQRAYFVTGAEIADADATAPKGGITLPGGTKNLYLFDASRSGAERWRFVASLVEPCAVSNAVPDYVSQFEGYAHLSHRKFSPNASCVRGTPSGSAIAFMSGARLTADDRDDAIDVYLYDAIEDELVRASAPPPGVGGYVCEETSPPNPTPLRFCNAAFGHRPLLGSVELLRGWGGGRNLNIAENADGAVSVFFESRSRLTPDDENEISDVYEWREGALSLLSGGLPGKHAFYSGNGVNGRDAFIWTSARLDPREIDDSDYDIYDARVGGGFPYVPPEQPCDALALGCEGEAIAPPAEGGAGGSSLALRGNGNVQPRGKPRRRCVKTRRVGRKRKCVRRQGRKRSARAPRRAAR